MGRVLKRVPLDFDAPLNKIWVGYINPHPYNKCEMCGGHGLSDMAHRAEKRWYGFLPFSPDQNGSTPHSSEHPSIMQRAQRNIAREHEDEDGLDVLIRAEARRLAAHFNSEWCYHLNDADVAALVADNRLWDFTHNWSQENGWQPKVPAYIPSAAEVNAWSMVGLGHDSINCFVVVKAWCERNKLPYHCPACNGDGWTSAEDRQRYESWEPIEPPAGEGFQLWEDTSEGSPISKVYKTLDELCEWAANNATVFGDHKASQAEWRRMLDDGLVCHQEGNMVFI